MSAEKKILIQDLMPGMYVSKLDRPWVETPFLFQGFTISNAKDVEMLRQHCEYVFIDPGRGEDNPRIKFREPASLEDKVVNLVKAPTGFQVYPVKTSLDEEREIAYECYDKVLDAIANALDGLRTGNKIELNTTKRAVNGMVSSIIRNPDAFVWLTRLKTKDAYAYTHAIDNSALAANFGRHLGLAREEICNLALATLLLDVGKIKIPEEMLAKPGRLTEEEFTFMRRHVEFSLAMLAETKGITKDILTTVATHHERNNGQGYPNGLAGGDIPVFGRIAAIVDCYDAITSERPYAKALSQHEAIRSLYEWRNHDFQADMVEQFIQCIGVYPTGSLVELTTGEVGIVLAQNPVRRLKPVVMLVLDRNKVAYAIQPRLDLVKDTRDSSGNPIEILKPLDSGSYGIDAAKYYI